MYRRGNAIKYQKTKKTFALLQNHYVSQVQFYLIINSKKRKQKILKRKIHFSKIYQNV